jgi:SAM-dependent methyltransferase
VLRCGACKFAFPVPYVAGDKSFYEIILGQPHYPSDRWEYDRALQFMLASAQTRTPRILEIGAGTGAFIKKLRKAHELGSPELFATDYSSYSVERLRALGVAAERADVLELAGRGDALGYFDYIFAFQSIEHMANVIDVFKALSVLLRPGGYFCLSVPNGAWIDFNERELKYFDMPPNHVGRWYPETFEALSQRSELTLVRHEVQLQDRWDLAKAVGSYRVNASAGEPGLAASVNAIRFRPLRVALKGILGTAYVIQMMRLISNVDFGRSQLAFFQRPTGRGAAG